MHVQQLLNCQVPAWLPSFQHVAYKTRLIDLPQDFVDFLVADGVYLPEGSAAVRHATRICNVRAAKLDRRYHRDGTGHVFAVFGMLPDQIMCISPYCCIVAKVITTQSIIIATTPNHVQLPTRVRPSADDEDDYKDWSDDEEPSQSAAEHTVTVHSRSAPPFAGSVRKS